MTARVVPFPYRRAAYSRPCSGALPVGARVRHLTRDQVGTVTGHGPGTLHWVRFPTREEWCCPQVSLALLAAPADGDPDFDHTDPDEPQEVA